MICLIFADIVVSGNNVNTFDLSVKLIIFLWTWRGCHFT